MRELVAELNAAMMGFAPDTSPIPTRPFTGSIGTRASARTKRRTRSTLRRAFAAAARWATQTPAIILRCRTRRSELAAACTCPRPETLLAIRNRIAEGHQEFRRIVGARAVRQLFGELQGERLSRVPKGFCAQHPAADLLRFKQLYLYIELPPDLATTRALYGEIVKRFRAMAPFLGFLTALRPLPLAAAREHPAGPGSWRSV